LNGSERLVRFKEPIEKYLETAGHVPLPPYIHTPLEDAQRYQTVYAKETGSAAAPTAGLHFTPDLIVSLQDQGIQFTQVVLHIGLDTFAPVNENDSLKHKMHSEWCQVAKEVAMIINKTRKEGKRIVAVGTTCVRTLESAAQHGIQGETVGSFKGSTDLFILPGYRFRAVDSMITNFHLPRSTLIMLVSAFAGREQILKVYNLAINKGYRFYSFGDAMLIL